MTVAEIEARFGRPCEAAFLAEYDPHEFAFLTGTMQDGRNQDVTLLIWHAGRVVQIRKPLYPPEVFRAPGGSPKAGEDLAACAMREAGEETGLDVHLERYLLRAHVTFRCGAESAQWVTHVFGARAETDILAPRDRVEVVEARWFTAEEFRRMNAMLAATSLPGLRYRAALQEAVWAMLEGP